jgi:hypothetical protein
MNRKAISTRLSVFLHPSLSLIQISSRNLVRSRGRTLRDITRRSYCNQISDHLTLFGWLKEFSSRKFLDVRTVTVDRALLIPTWSPVTDIVRFTAFDPKFTIWRKPWADQYRDLNILLFQELTNHMTLPSLSWSCSSCHARWSQMLPTVGSRWNWIR